MEARMTCVHTQTGATGRRGCRARDTTARLVGIYSLGLATCLSLTSALQAQGVAASREARATSNSSKTMTELNTVDVPLRIPALRAVTENESVRPFRFSASDEELAELRRRILATRWPERETVADFSQGVPLATMQKLARYWAEEHDWRKVEEKLNSYPQFITNIDGLDIHFIHVRSKEKNALPVIVTHGWPGSIIEQLKIIDPLTNPTAYGGKSSAGFAF